MPIHNFKNFCILPYSIIFMITLSLMITIQSFIIKLVMRSGSGLADQCRLLGFLYQQKYCKQSKSSSQPKHSQHRKSSLIDSYLQGHNTIYVTEKKQKNLEPRLRTQSHYPSTTQDMAEEKPSLKLAKHSSNKLYDLSYSNQPIEMSQLSFKQFAQQLSQRQKRVSRSVAGNRSCFISSKSENSTAQIKNAILHSRQSLYTIILKNRKAIQRKQSSQKYESSANTNNQNTSRPSQKSKDRNSDRQNARNSTIAEARKRTMLTIIKKRNLAKSNQAKKDENDLLPWNVDIEEFIYKDL